MALVKSQPLPQKIMTADMYKLFAEELKAAVQWLKAWDGHHDPIIASAHKTHTLALAAKAKYRGPVDTRRAAIARLIGAYDNEQKLLAARRAEELRRVAEDAERERRANEIAAARERQRQAEEERAKAEADAAAARELAAEAPDDKIRNELLDAAADDERVADDRALEAAYEEQAVQQAAAAPIIPAFVEVPDETPKVEGVSSRTTWFAEIVDGKKYLESLLTNYDRHKVLIAAMLEKAMPALNREATSTKQQIEIAPGVYARPKYGAAAKP